MDVPGGMAYTAHTPLTYSARENIYTGQTNIGAIFSTNRGELQFITLFVNLLIKWVHYLADNSTEECQYLFIIMILIARRTVNKTL